MLSSVGRGPLAPIAGMNHACTVRPDVLCTENSCGVDSVVFASHAAFTLVSCFGVPPLTLAIHTSAGCVKSLYRYATVLPSSDVVHDHASPCAGVTFWNAPVLTSSVRMFEYPGPSTFSSKLPSGSGAPHKPPPSFISASRLSPQPVMFLAA